MFLKIIIIVTAKLIHTFVNNRKVYVYVTFLLFWKKKNVIHKRNVLLLRIIFLYWTDVVIGLVTFGVQISISLGGCGDWRSIWQ